MAAILEVSADTNGPADRLCLAKGRATGPTRGHGGGADHVGKQHRDLPALHPGRPQQAGQPRAQRRGGQFEHRIAQPGALASSAAMAARTASMSWSGIGVVSWRVQ